MIASSGKARFSELAEPTDYFNCKTDCFIRVCCLFNLGEAHTETFKMISALSDTTLAMSLTYKLAT